VCNMGCVVARCYFLVCLLDELVLRMGVATGVEGKPACHFSSE
jgi:hypothetical protein